MRDIFKNRHKYGAFKTLLKELRFDQEYFFRYIRMSQERFDHLLSLAENSIEEHYLRTNTQFLKAITAEACLAITLMWYIKVIVTLCIRKEVF